MWLNSEPEEEALNDAKLFIDEAKLIQSEEVRVIINIFKITFEEFVFAMARIANMYGIEMVSRFITTFGELIKTKKRQNEY